MNEILIYNLEVFSLGMYLIGSILFVAGSAAAIVVQQLRK